MFATAGRRTGLRDVSLRSWIAGFCSSWCTGGHAVKVVGSCSLIRRSAILRHRRLDDRMARCSSPPATSGHPCGHRCAIGMEQPSLDHVRHWGPRVASSAQCSCSDSSRWTWSMRTRSTSPDWTEYATADWSAGTGPKRGHGRISASDSLSCGFGVESGPVVFLGAPLLVVEPRRSSATPASGRAPSARGHE